MSGGVDSSLAAALLQEDGYDVVGVTMKLWESDVAPSAKNVSCCSVESVVDARAVCARLGVPHYVLDLTSEFERFVVDDFVDEYASGRTPNPCIRCNTFLKWDALLSRSRAFGADLMATGHYARIDGRGDGPVELRRGMDARKDQSYALWGVPQEALRRTILPLGSLTKNDVRRMAADRGMSTAAKPESQDVCFVPDGDYGVFLDGWTRARGRACGALEPGPIRGRDGAVLGEHSGVARYTIGQRKGLGIALGAPQFVTRIDVPARTVWVGDESDLLAHGLRAGAASWISGERPADEFRAEAKIRYGSSGIPAEVTLGDTGTFQVRFDSPQRAVTAGQSVVLYDDDIVIGGGVIYGAIPS